MRQTKKSNLYQMAMIAVVQAEHLTPMLKIEIIDQLLADHRLAAYNERAEEQEGEV